MRSLFIVSETTDFSVSYLDLRLARATSAVCLLALTTVRKVAICSRLVDSNAGKEINQSATYSSVPFDST